MSKSDRFALLVFGTLLSIACVADDEKAPADEADSLAAESSALGELLQQPAYSERWQLNPDLEPAADSQNSAAVKLNSQTRHDPSGSLKSSCVRPTVSTSSSYRSPTTASRSWFTRGTAGSTP